MKRSSLFIIVLSMFAILLFVLLQVNGKKRDETITLDREGSWFSYLSVEDGVVKIYCHLKIMNEGAKERRFSIWGYSEEDYRAGLIKSEQLQCFNKSDGSDTFAFLPAEEIIELDAVFVGEHDTSNEKQNRLLPARVVFVDNETGIQYPNLT